MLSTTKCAEPVLCINQALGTFEFDKRYKCPVCDITFVKEQTVRIHCNRNHSGVYDSLEFEKVPVFSNGGRVNVIPSKQNSSKCGDQLKSIHESDTHFGKALDAPSPLKSEQLQPTNTHLDNNPSCDYCKNIFLHKESLVKHFKLHYGPHTVECHICKVPYRNSKLLKVSRIGKRNYSK